MRIVVTGADGFVGTGLTSALANAGHLALNLGPANEIDIRDTELVRARLSTLAPDRIIHLAAISGPMLHREQPELVMAVNAVGTVNVLESALRQKTPVILASSVSGYTMGTAEQPRPASVYGVTKRAGEMLAAVYREELGLRCTSVRIGSVYGPGRHTEHVLDEMIARALSGADVPYSAAGEEPLVHIRDAAVLLEALAEASSWRPHYDLVTTPISHAELARIVCELAGTGSQPVREDHPVYTWPMPFDATSLYEDTGRDVAVSVRSGIAELLDRARAERASSS